MITDISNTLLHYTVEGSTVKEVVKIVLEVPRRQTDRQTDRIPCVNHTVFPLC